MSEIIDNGAVIYKSPSKSYRFSCYKKDLDGNLIIENGLPAKYHFSCTNRELRLTDPLKIKSIDDWLAYHTVISMKDGVEIKSCPIKLLKYTEAEALKLLEPEAVAMKDGEGRDIKVSVDELKKAYLEMKAREPDEEKGSTVVHGTRTSKNNPKSK